MQHEIVEPLPLLQTNGTLTELRLQTRQPSPLTLRVQGRVAAGGVARADGRFDTGHVLAGRRWHGVPRCCG